MAEHKAPPPAPAYTAVPMAPLARPLQVAVIDGDRWVCMRSLIEGLGMSWRRWWMLFLAGRLPWASEAGADSQGKPTRLMRAHVAYRWLLHCYPLILETSSKAAGRRAKELRIVWPSWLGQAAAQTATQEPHAATKRGRPRTINAQTIERLHAALMQTADFRQAALASGVNERTAERLMTRSYPGSTADMDAAWVRTFGENWPAAILPPG